VYNATIILKGKSKIWKPQRQRFAATSQETSEMTRRKQRNELEQQNTVACP